MNNCKCDLADYCERYTTKVTPRIHAVCRGESGWPPDVEAGFRKVWERVKVSPQPHPVPFKLGDTVARLIKICTFGLAKPKSGCGCTARQGKLNVFGERVAAWFQRKPTISPQRIAECHQVKAEYEASIVEQVAQATDI